MSGNKSGYKESWKAVDVKCPFFLGERGNKKTIVCEGWADKMKVTMEFGSHQCKDAYMGRHCVGPYQRCKIYQATMDKYEIK